MTENLRRLARGLRQKTLPDVRLFPGGYALPPVDITLELTYACNLKCPMCYQKAVQESTDIQPVAAGKTPGPDVFRRLIRQVARFNPTIRMTGGEPMLYPEYIELATVVKECGLRLILPTNGTRIASRAEILVALSLDVLIVTLMGPEPVHDRIVGVPGAFQAAFEGIRAVLKARNRCAAEKPKVLINTVWSPQNLHQMDELVRLSEEAEVDALSFTHIWFWDESTCGLQYSRFPEFGRLTPTPRSVWEPIQPEVMIEQIRRLRGMQPGIPIRFYPDLDETQIRTYYTRPDTPVTNSLCKVPWLAVYIRPNGDVAPCYLNHSVGNLRDADFMEIWNNPEYRQFRKTRKQSGAFPACHRCTGSFLFHGGFSGRTRL
ncbi:MAG TPA: radical SAM protein [bacterium]|nr:radical SAM protein [bacterium]